MSSGMVSIELIRQGEPEPIYNAAVVVGRGEDAQIFLSDSGGRAEFQYPAPPEELSLMKSSEIRPYSLCEIQISAPGINETYYTGCQVFPGINTVLRCEVQPKIKSVIKKKKTIRIPAHGMWAHSPNNKDGGAFSRELDSVEQIMPVLCKNMLGTPDFLTVHLGRADENALDITVSFSDYIKNISSGILYPTWPEEALRAYILSLISEVRKRVKTGYYRNLKYNFDMAAEKYARYFDGRMTFEPINRITDELICWHLSADGCLLISPWEYVFLTQKGLKSEEILKHLSGGDIMFCQYRNTEQADFTETVKKGCAGSEVKAVQQCLNRIAIHYLTIPFIKDTEGYFGSCTESAIKAYQQQFGLDDSGFIDKTTWQSITYAANAVNKYRNTGRDANTEASLRKKSVIFLGDTGQEVVRLQHFINSISRKFGKRCVPPVLISGEFDERTRDSVNKYQKYKRLPQSGAVDKKTWSMLYDDIADFASIIQKPKKHPGMPVVKGSEGENVIFIQGALNSISKVLKGNGGLNIDGIFGGETEKAVTEVQILFGLQSNGEVDEKTWHALSAEYMDLAGIVSARGYYAEG
ncbi:MAG: peptidoglycan-binding protein [Eubacteriales bacterium]|nr:peptidoglycan-binding protein [Eubacteriales bacterium]MDD4422789.1 peptidoglycan-binding protein [Eubacteriales bacterium]